MSDVTTYDLIVIGGGPAGYVAAIRAGQLGRKVACIEAERAGGTCLNWGCIPSKALLKSAEFYAKMKKAETLGLGATGVTFDFAKVMQRSRGVADQMAKGVEFLFRKYKVDYFIGRGQVIVPGMVEITAGEHKGDFFKTQHILLATGCKPRQLPGLPVDGERVMTSREALVPRAQPPASVAIIGAGAIGVEFAYFLNAFGSKVTLIEVLPQVVPAEDEEVARLLHRSFEKQGIAIHTATKAENIQVGKSSVTMDLVKGDQRQGLEVETVIVAVGVTANLDGALSPKVKLDLDRGFVKVDENYQSSVKGIYAAGDIIGPPWLAHVAMFRAVNAVNGMFGHGRPHREKNSPGCTYCQPQIASIGLTEKAAKEKGIAYKVGKFPFLAAGKAVAAGESEGFVKVLADSQTGEILGAHIIGAEATELISEYSLAMTLEATVDEIHATIHPHPTLGEAVMEAAASALGEAIHI
ncbi:MAG TPA: dihydrolipoyl dehydrogenase [Opitutaceae bacterium]|nr:dihydrolipoyl dehydrogenase [Opitutaceae bacterium]